MSGHIRSFTRASTSPGRDDAAGRRAQHAPRRGHDHRRRDALVGDVADDDAELAVGQLDEVVEVAADLARGPVVRGDVPAVVARGASSGRKFCWISVATRSSCSIRSRDARLGLLAPDELGDLERGRRLRGERVEELAVVGRVLLVGEARPEVEHADELALADERHHELDARSAKRSSAGESMLEARERHGAVARSGRTRRSGRSARSRTARARGTRPRPTGPTRSGRPSPRCGLAAARCVSGAGSCRRSITLPSRKRYGTGRRAESRCVYDPPVELRLALLGAPVAEVDGRPLAVDTRKAIALLAYLAVEGGSHSRDSLAALLWPDYDGERARAALRRTLSTLRSALGDRWLTTQRDTVSLDRRRRGVRRRRAPGGSPAEGAFEAAAALHRGPFLAGFGLRDSDRLRQLAVAHGGNPDARARLGARPRRRRARGGGRLGRGDRARAAAARARPGQRAGPPPADRALRGSGDRNAAVAQYRDCVRTLYRELGVSPIESTTALYRSILEGAAAAPADEPAPPAGRSEHTLVGRTREWKALREAYAAVGDGRRGRRDRGRGRDREDPARRGARRVGTRERRRRGHGALLRARGRAGVRHRDRDRARRAR